MTNDLKVGILGGAGRMGQMNIRQVTATEGCVVAGATARPGSEAVGRDAGVIAGLPALGVSVSDDAASIIAGVDVVIDFTTPDVAVDAAQLAAKAGAALIAGTTGLSPEQEEEIVKAARHVPVVRAANTSVGVTLLAALAEQAAQMFDETTILKFWKCITGTRSMHHPVRRWRLEAPLREAVVLSWPMLNRQCETVIRCPPAGRHRLFNPKGRCGRRARDHFRRRRRARDPRAQSVQPPGVRGRCCSCGIMDANATARPVQYAARARLRQLGSAALGRCAWESCGANAVLRATLPRLPDVLQESGMRRWSVAFRDCPP